MLPSARLPLLFYNPRMPTNDRIDAQAWLDIRAGRAALAHLHSRGLAPGDIACVPAAAGGPKGLALIPLDGLLLGEWLRDVRDLHLIGASIGAWRMAAASTADPLPALRRLSDGYVAQRYPRNPGPDYVSAECRKLARAVLGAAVTIVPRPGVRLSIVTARARGALRGTAGKRAFAQAALANAVGRSRLALHLERVVFGARAASAGEAAHPASTPAITPAVTPFDAFGWTEVDLNEANAEDALLASGSIPLVCAPVRNPAGAPPGEYWDGGLIDYHLHLPYERLLDAPGTAPRLVLYPHFVPHVTPGWLDKHLPWRRHPRASAWLDRMLLIAPSRALLERLPNRKLPDRNDFYRYGLDHAARERDWRRAIAESERFAQAAMAWLARPDPTIVRPL